MFACIGFLYKVVLKIGRLRKFNRSREIEFNFLTAWTVSMKFGTLVEHAPGYKSQLHNVDTVSSYEQIGTLLDPQRARVREREREERERQRETERERERERAWLQKGASDFLIFA